jgi:hypothetical protein
MIALRAALRWYFTGLIGASIFATGTVTGIAIECVQEQRVIPREVMHWAAARAHKLSAETRESGK